MRVTWRSRAGHGLLILSVVGFAAANLVNALHKGGDFQVFVESGRRVLERLPLYEGSGAGVGVVGPPFQGVFFTPFAMLASVGMPLARVAWYAVGLGSLAAGVALWSAALDRRHRPDPAAGVRLFDPVRLSSWPVLLPLIAILFPAQTNFEHQNMNPLLLACLGGAAYALRTRRETWAGAFIGAATALKAYPGLVALSFIHRRAWRGLAAAVGTAALLSLLPALAYGPGELAALFGRWLSFSAAGGWPTVGNNQSIVAMVERFVGVDSRLVAPLYAGAIVALLAAFVWAARPPGDAAPDDLAALTLVAVIASPIAWEHYWILMFPAFFVAYNSHRYETSRWARIGFWTAVVLTSGLSRNTLGVNGFEFARTLSNSTWAALLLFALTLAARRGTVAGQAGREADATPASPASYVPRR